ncbi:putative rad21/Rec8-like protein [Helianthus annuus]|nr:putative rad21/Rec8-like protein [Helianthus annuus]
MVPVSIPLYIRIYVSVTSIFNFLCVHCCFCRLIQVIFMPVFFENTCVCVYHNWPAKKGPLGTIWIAAHLERKLRKNQVADTDIGVSVGYVLIIADLTLQFWCSLASNIARMDGGITESCKHVKDGFSKYF